MIFFDDIKKRVEQDKPFLIAYYGASTTSFEYVFPNWGEVIRYVLKDELERKTGDYQKAYWNLQTINLGLNGASSSDLLERFDSLILKVKPDLLFLSAGKNDFYYDIDKKITRENTRKLIEKTLENNIRAVFMTTVPSLRPDLNEKLAGHVEIDRAVADDFSENNNFIFIDFYNLFPENLIEKSYSLISSGGNEHVGYKPGETDPIHYNKYGNAAVAEILLKEVFNIDFNKDIFLKDLNDPAKKYPEY